MAWQAKPAAVAAFVAAVLTLGSCTVGTPFQTVEKADRAKSSDRNDTRIVVVTEFTMGSDTTARTRFWDQVWTVERTMKDQPGLVGYALRRQLFGDTAWTMTIWQDEQSIRNFVRSPAHQTAMAQGGPAAARMRFVRFPLAPYAPHPSWDEALVQLEKKGRTHGYE